MVALLLLAAGLVWLAARPETLAWAAQHASRLTDGRLAVEGVTGSLFRELTARYAFLVANKRPAVDLFTEDGGFVFRKPDGEVGEARGRQELDQVFADILRAPNHNLPTVHNHLISIDGDHATGVCWIELQAHKMEDNGDIGDWRGSGYYEDIFRRENGRWKFVLRDSTLVKFELVRP